MQQMQQNPQTEEKAVSDLSLAIQQGKSDTLYPAFWSAFKENNINEVKDLLAKATGDYKAYTQGHGLSNIFSALQHDVGETSVLESLTQVFGLLDMDTMRKFFVCCSYHFDVKELFIKANQGDCTEFIYNYIGCHLKMWEKGEKNLQIFLNLISVVASFKENIYFLKPCDNEQDTVLLSILKTVHIFKDHLGRVMRELKAIVAEKLMEIFRSINNSQILGVKDSNGKTPKDYISGDLLKLITESLSVSGFPINNLTQLFNFCGISDSGKPNYNLSETKSTFFGNANSGTKLDGIHDDLRNLVNEYLDAEAVSQNATGIPKTRP